MINTASVFSSSSSNIVCFVGIAASRPASWPAQTFSEPIEAYNDYGLLIQQFFFLKVRKNLWVLILFYEFLLSGMSWQARNPLSEVDSSSVQSFLVTLTSVWQRSEDNSPKFFDNKICFQPSASKPEGPDTPLFSWLLFISFLHR